MLEGVDVNLNEELGRGSYAKVFKAEWLGLPCVAKVFHTDIFPKHHAETWKLLGREIQLLQQIRHPNIVQLLGFVSVSTTNIPSIVMELLDTNLTNLLERRGVLPFDIQVGILHDVAVGLSFLHGQKDPIIHRDLSSNNILLTNHLVAKISDLGLAKHIKSPELQAGSAGGFGTPYFMPPEVIGQNPPQISPKTDIFSFGVVTLQIATGKFPEVRGSINLDAEANRRMHHIKQLEKNNPLHQIILQCLSKSEGRPLAIELCKSLKKFKSTMKTTLDFRNECITAQKEKDDLSLKLEQKNADMQEMQDNAHKELEALHAKLAKEKESKEASALKNKKLEGTIDKLTHNQVRLQKQVSDQQVTAKRKFQSEQQKQKLLRDENSMLKRKITEVKQSQPLNVTKLLVEQNIKLANLLESTNDDLKLQKQCVKELLDRMSKTDSTSSSIDETLQQCKADRSSITAQMQDTAKHFSQLEHLLQRDDLSPKSLTLPSQTKSVTGTAVTPIDDDMPQCPLCHMTFGSKNELQLHYLQSCAGYDNPGTFVSK